MIYSNNDMPWWAPCAKNMNSLFFVIILMKLENQKEIVLLLKPTTKSKATKWKTKEDFFICILCPKWPFKMAA